MPARSFVRLSKAVHTQIARWAEKAYPHEGCGLLIGRFHSSGEKEVVRMAALKNGFLSGRLAGGAPTLPSDRQGPGAGKTEFLMDPGEFNRETLQAEKEGLDVVGIIHTHPDHPARPSPIDAAQPFLAQWSNIIVAVEKGGTKEIKSWFRERDGQPFDEEEIRIEST